MNKQIAILGGSLNPPGAHHVLIARKLQEQFGQVIIVPCGSKRMDKPGLERITRRHRKAMVDLAFSGTPGLQVDFYDLDMEVYTPTIELYRRYTLTCPWAKLWFAVGGDLVLGGGQGESQIQRSWVEGLRVWQELNFAVIAHPGCPAKREDLPPHHRLVTMPEFFGRATLIRQRLALGQDIRGLVPDPVADYIWRHHLYCAA